MNKDILKLLNEQVNHELFSYYQYLAMSAYFEEQSLKGFAAFFLKQSQEEQEHGMKIFHFIFTRNQKVTLETIKKPKNKWGSIKEVIEDSLKQECKITSLINTIVSLSQDKKDHATFQFLQWFIEEQVEEEEQMNDILQQLEIIGPNKSGLLMIDNLLYERTLKPDN